MTCFSTFNQYCLQSPNCFGLWIYILLSSHLKSFNGAVQAFGIHVLQNFLSLRILRESENILLILLYKLGFILSVQSTQLINLSQSQGSLPPQQIKLL